MTHVKKRTPNYAGIAAVITAVGGIVALFINQSHNDERAVLVEDSVLVLLQYRLGDLEDQVDGIEEEFLALRFELASRPGSKIVTRAPEFAPEPPPEEDEVLLPGAPSERPERVLEKVVARIKAKKTVEGAELRNFVQQMGRPLVVGDLEAKE